jgi:acetyl-CoA carboxylase carboxyltransferase component
VTTATYSEQSEQFDARVRHALAMGGSAKLEQRRATGALNARERVERLLDEGSFKEIGTLATSAVAADRESTPADGKITGLGRIDAQPGDSMDEDQVVLTLESMKMEIPVIAPETCRLISVLVKEGEAVREGQDLSVIEHD